MLKFGRLEGGLPLLALGEDSVAGVVAVAVAVAAVAAMATVATVTVAAVAVSSVASVATVAAVATVAVAGVAVALLGCVVRGRVAVVVGRTVRSRSGMMSRRCRVSSIGWLAVCWLGVSVVAIGVTVLVGLVSVRCRSMSIMGMARGGECICCTISRCCIVGVEEARVDWAFNFHACGSSCEKGYDLRFHHFNFY